VAVRRTWLLLAVLGWFGCGSPAEPEVASDVEVATTEQEVVPASCTSAALVNTTCGGPIEYALPCYVSKPSSVCGIQGYEQKTCYPSCAHPDFGAAYLETRYFSVSVTPTSTTQRVCELNQWGKPICFNETYYYYDTPCANAAAAKRNEWPEPYRSNITTSWSVNAYSYGDPGTCNITVYNAPVYNTSSGWQCGAGSSCNDTTRPIYKTCRHSSHGVAPAGNCGPDTRYTAPGQTLAGANSEAQSVWTSLGNIEALSFTKAPACLTCDTTALSTATDAQNKYTCLENNLNRVPGLPSGAAPSGVDRGALESQLVTRMKLLFETKGDQLSSVQQGRAMDLYVNRPQPTSGCGLTWTQPTTTAACATPAALPGLNNTFSMCHLLRSEHVPAGVTGLALDRCTATSATIKPLSADCGAEGYRTAYDDVTTALLVKSMPAMTTTLGTAPREAELRTKLASVQQWYTRARTDLYPADPVDGKLLGRTSEVMKAFWNAAYLKDELALAVTTDAAAESARAKVLADGLVADRQVLRAAFGAAGTPPLTRAPLLFLLGDALRGLDERLLEVSRLHDMGCRFKTCNTTATPTSELMGMLGSLTDANRLSSRLTASTRAAADWKAVFTLVQSNHCALQSAIHDALGVPAGTVYDANLLFTRPLDAMPVPAQQLASMLRDAKARAEAHAANGLFGLTDTRTVKVGLNRQKQDEILNHLNTILQQLDTGVSSYDANRLSLVQGLVTQLQNQNSQQSLLDRMTAVQNRLAELQQDLNGLRTSHAVDEARYGDFMDGFEALYPAIAQTGQDMLKAEYTVTAPNRGRMATTSNDVAGMAVLSGTAPFKLSASPGDQLAIQVSGTWSPTCAIGLTQGPNGSLVRPNNTQGQVKTGPEGYSVTVSSGTYTAQGNESVTSRGQFANSTETQNWCAGFGISLPIPVIGDLVNVGARIEGCMTDETGTNWSQTSNQSSSSGSETRSTFSLARGLRSPLAPFPDQPVGSLLLVRMRRDGTTRADIRSVQVLQSPSVAVLVPGDPTVDVGFDYYLVVNDRVDTRCTWLDNSLLNVRLAHLRPQSVEARNVAVAMSAAEALLRTQADTYVAQGRLLPSQADLLRDTAYGEVYNRCNCTSISAYPESVRTLFDTWVKKAVVGVEREVELVNIERQLRALLLDMRALDAELDNAQLQSRLMGLQPAWALRNLDGAQLRSQLEALDQVMSDWLAPVIALQHPETLTSFTTSERQLLDDLTNVDPTSSTTNIRNLASTAKAAAQAVENRLRAVRVAAPVPTLNDVILSIPQPGKTATSSWRKVDPATAQAVWAEILAGRNPVLTLKPEHLYSPFGGSGLLPCNLSSPIISSVVLYGILPTGSTSNPYTVPLSLTPEMSFPTVSRLERYAFASPNYLGPASQMLFGQNSEVLSKLQTYWGQPGTQVGAGLSPFSSIHLELGAFSTDFPSAPGTLSASNPLSKTVELLVAFRLEPRQEPAGSKLLGVTQCE
jgi:hypothetical protein